MHLGLFLEIWENNCGIEWIWLWRDSGNRSRTFILHILQNAIADILSIGAVSDDRM